MNTPSPAKLIHLTHSPARNDAIIHHNNSKLYNMLFISATTITHSWRSLSMTNKSAVRSSRPADRQTERVKTSCAQVIPPQNQYSQPPFLALLLLLLLLLFVRLLALFFLDISCKVLRHFVLYRVWLVVLVVCFVTTVI